ncbi:hypothetical protein ACFUMH_11755 [Cellulomonas sp. NPDC057328]|uniref:hypothetical protein n=1 Tax=Cellulomonas sp. NPDC057328 TaxID=3346101 RepID=UPI00362EC7A7
MTARDTVLPVVLGRARRALAAAVVASLTLAAPAATAPAVAATAAPVVTVCRDSDLPYWPTVVAGDVHVVGHCWLTGLVVTGDVVVTPGAVLSADGLRLQGDLRLRGGSSAWVRSSRIGGGVQAEGAAELGLDGVRVARSVRGRIAETTIESTVVAGAVNVAAPDDGAPGQGLHLLRSTVGGWVNVHAGHDDIAWSTLSRGLTLSWTRSAIVSESTVLGDVTVRRAAGTVRLGGWRWHPLGWSRPFAGPTDVGGDLVLEANDAAPVLTTLDVAGDLLCTGSSRAPEIADDVVVAGARTGRCS